MEKAPLIQLKNVIKTYINGDITYTALRGVDVTINEGEMVAITGPSGSGKSTLMHILGALDTPTSGDYMLKGKKITAFTEKELSAVRRDNIGFVFQAFNLLPRTSVLKNIELQLFYQQVPKKERRQRALGIIKKVGLEGKENNKSNQLSGGQIQRVAIARALVANPSLILADEPTGNLDTATSHEIMMLLQQMNKEGKTVLIITHEMDIAKFAQRIIQLRDGNIVNSTDKS